VHAAKSIVSRTSRPVIVRTWQHRSVVFDAASGDTLFLDDLGTSILRLLEIGPIARDALVSSLGQQFEGSAGQIADASGNAIAELCKLGLIVELPA